MTHIEKFVATGFIHSTRYDISTRPYFVELGSMDSGRYSVKHEIGHPMGPSWTGSVWERYCEQEGINMDNNRFAAPWRHWTTADVLATGVVSHIFNPWPSPHEYVSVDPVLLRDYRAHLKYFGEQPR